jgi:ferredoxin
VLNILKANITPEEEGVMVLEISGDAKDYEKGIAFLRNLGVLIQSLSQDIIRDEVRCTHCGVCISMCPTKALSIERKTMKVLFDKEKCIACGFCVNICPTKSIKIKI